MMQQLKENRFTVLALFFGVNLLLFPACNSSVDQPAEVEQISSQPPPVALPVSINAIMVAQVDHCSHRIWEVGDDAHAPKTDQQWKELEHHAIQLASAGSLIALGGSGPSDAGWVQEPDWQRFSQDLSDAGLASLTAVRSRNLEALLEAGNDLVDTCEGCHAQFKPDVPTEGIMHPH